MVKVNKNNIVCCINKNNRVILFSLKSFIKLKNVM